MALPSKGLRKIVVDDEAFQYRVSKPKPLDYPIVDGRYMLHPIGINIYVQSASDPKSLFTHLYAFEEREDVPSVTPASLAHLIRRARASGWCPDEPGHFSTEGLRLDWFRLVKMPTRLTAEETSDFVRNYSGSNRKSEVRHHK